MVVENVKGAQPWVGKAKANFGSFYLWGDVAMVGNRVVSSVPAFGQWTRPMRAQKFNPDGTEHPQGSWFKIADSKERGARKNSGGSWFNIGSPGQTEWNRNPVHELAGQKVPGMTSWSDHGKPDYKPQGFNVTAAQRYREEHEGTKHGGDCFSDPNWPGKQGGTKQRGTGPEWFDNGIARHSSKSDSRKAASAQIAKIPLPLSQYIARAYRPHADSAQ